VKVRRCIYTFWHIDKGFVNKRYSRLAQR
jgi:hypothetical protein